MTDAHSLSLGHIVVNVADLAVSVPYYCRVLGLKEVARNEARQMVFLSFGVKDHDLVLRLASLDAKSYEDCAVGLRQIAFRLSGELAELRAFRDHLLSCGVAIRRIDQHVASTSIYFADPNGIELEAYIEHPRESWQGERQALRFSHPVTMD
jgi:catechol-2,3-dioxygenase